MLIELFGLPCSGKSTLSLLVADQLRGDGLAVNETTRVVDHQYLRAARLAKKGGGLLRYAATRPRNARMELGQIFATRQASSRDLARSMFNWMFIASVVARQRNEGSVVLLDQGLAQAIWTIGYAARKPNWLDLVLAGQELDALMPDAIIWVRANCSTVSHRLAQRRQGGSRLDGKRVDEDALNRAEVHCESIVARVREYKVKVLEVDNDEPDHLIPAADIATDEIRAMLASK